MNKLTSSSPAKTLNVAGLVATSAGLLILIIAGIVPQDVLVVALIPLMVAGLVAFLPWRWIPIIGVILPLFMLVGAIASFSNLIHLLTNLAKPVSVLGTVVQMVGLITAVLAGIAATVQNYRVSRSTARW